MTDHDDDGIRQLIEAGRDRAPLAPGWSEVVARSDRRAVSRRRNLLATAAAIVAIGLGGLLAVSVMNGDEVDNVDLPPAPTNPDTAAETTVATASAADPLADLSDDDWVVPSRLPDGYRRLSASVGPSDGRRSQIFAHADRDRQVRLDVHRARPESEDAEAVRIDGVIWQRRTMSFDGDGTDGTDGKVELARTVNERTVTLRAATTDAEVLDEFARSLIVVPGDEIDFEYLDPDEFFTVVATIDADDGPATLSVNGLDGYYCWKVEYAGASGQGSCENTTTPDHPLVEMGSLSDTESTFVAGMADPSVVRIDVETAAGDIVSIEPRDDSGQFDHGFWLRSGGLAGSLVAADGVTVHLDDGAVVDLEASALGVWVVPEAETVDEPDDELDPSGVNASEIPDDWLPTPPISEATRDDNPLLDDMLPASEYVDDPEHLPYVALIGASRYIVVDANGDPIEAADEVYHHRSIEITAFHGSDRPVVYGLHAAASYDDPEFGYQTDDRGVTGVLEKDPGTNRYRFVVGDVPRIFEDRWFFHQDEPLDDLSRFPFLASEFTIDIDDDRSLTVTSDDGTVTRLAWRAVEV